MSIAASNWAWQQTCIAARASETDQLSASPVSQKMVLLFLADLANHNGECSPGLKTICASTGMEKKTAKKAIQRLLDQGLLSSRERRDGTHNQLQTPLYRLPVAAPPAPTQLPDQVVVVDFRPNEPDEGEVQVDTTGEVQVDAGGSSNVASPPVGVQRCSPPRSNFSQNSADFAPDAGNSPPVVQPSVAISSTYKDSFLLEEETPISPKESPTESQNPIHTPRARKNRAPCVADEKVKEAVAVWNTVLGRILPAVRDITDARAKELSKVLTRPDFAAPDAWRKFCEGIAASSRLQAREVGGWRADFDWVLKPKNLVRIIEGVYRDTPPIPSPAVVAKRSAWNPSGMTGALG
jgi:hypothetical protein